MTTPQKYGIEPQLDRQRYVRREMGFDRMTHHANRFRIHPDATVVGDNTAGLITLVRRAIRTEQDFRVGQDARFLAPDASDSAYLPSFECATSGTTAAPKIIRRSQASWIKSFEVNTELFDFGTHTRAAVLGQLNHSLALYGFVEALYVGAEIALLDHMRADRQIATLTDFETNLLYATPTQLRMLCRVAGSKTLPALGLILCGGGTLDETLRAHMAQVFPNANTRIFYGASETSFITLSDDQMPSGSVGRPYPNVEIDIRNPQPDGIGELWVRSPYVFSGYAIGADRNTKIVDGFVTIGEMGWRDENGYVFLAGRKIRMLTVADQNVFPEMVETLIGQLAPHYDCAVVSLPDPLRGHILVAVLEGQQDDQIVKSLRAHLRSELGPTRTPKMFIFVDTLPRTKSGKVNLITLTAQITEMI